MPYIEYELLQRLRMPGFPQSSFVSCSVMSNSLRPHGLWPWDSLHGILSMAFSKQESWSDCHALLQGIFLIQGSNLGLLHCKLILYHLSHQGSLWPAIRVGADHLCLIKDWTNLYSFFVFVFKFSLSLTYSYFWSEALQDSKWELCMFSQISSLWHIINYSFGLPSNVKLLKRTLLFR